MLSRLRKFIVPAPLVTKPESDTHTHTCSPAYGIYYGSVRLAARTQLTPNPGGLGDHNGPGRAGMAPGWDAY
jgi:hypothetical protein